MEISPIIKKTTKIKTMFRKINPKEISENAIKLIAGDWALVSAGSPENFNSMTVSWGGIGEMWGRDVVFIFIRPNRYTYEFVEKNELFSVCFFHEKYRESLKICGTKSGRDGDKLGLTQLNAQFTSSLTPIFKEAKLVLECKKMYSDFIKPECFLDKDQIERWYPDKSFHKMYVAEIKNCWIAKS